MSRSSESNQDSIRQFGYGRDNDIYSLSAEVTELFLNNAINSCLDYAQYMAYGEESGGGKGQSGDDPYAELRDPSKPPTWKDNIYDKWNKSPPRSFEERYDYKFFQDDPVYGTTEGKQMYKEFMENVSKWSYNWDQSKY